MTYPTPPPSVLSAALEDKAFHALRDLVLSAGGIDLLLYKNRCVLRRIAVRRRVCGDPDLRMYLKRVQTDPLERGRLVKALTIHVSRFFRNPSTFRAIQKEILPAILAGKERATGRALRVWSAGCAYGEEPYSLALLLLERPQALQRYSTRIYATDIDADCLRVARHGWYPTLSLASVPPDWKRRYFAPVDAGYQVSPDARRLVQFIPHSILDPVPFGRIDLVVLRNVLIYMTERLQERVLGSVSAALNPGGYLVLGKVEGLSGAAKALFEPVRISERIFRKLASPDAFPRSSREETRL
jgi:chemotaxis protein methyltransferase CheR